ncbi:ADP-dependent glucokinase [Paragonimus westermani]|uniref:ADP-dependent glucokinase n=1 Tax=Paragonimus westermani TaxID=34504 RepID=A0A5J4NIR7_9TREM|nr:ADP-dependent glucokinase [Paragonimus westermani]
MQMVLNSLQTTFSSYLVVFPISAITAPPAFGLPEVPEEDVHLILEYDAGERWGTLVAPRANRLSNISIISCLFLRYIIIRDQESPRLSGLWPGLLETWQTLVSGAGAATGSNIDKPPYPDLVVIGGLQLMDNWGFRNVPDIRSARLAELGMFLCKLPSETLVHFEMASFVNQVFANEMLRRILPHVDSIGLNEQELPNLASLLSNGTITSISSAYPRAAHMLDAMRTVWAFLNDPSLPRVSSASGPGWRRLSRIHLHTIAHQLIMVRRHVRGGAFARKQLDAMIDSGGMSARRTDIGLAWPFNRAAVAKASLIANRHTCASSAIDPVRTRLLMDDSFAVTADPQRWRSALHGAGDIGWDKRTPDHVPRIHFNATDPVTCWSEPEPDLTNTEESRLSEYFTPSRFETQIEVCVAPVLVCSEVRQTVGAGDNISAGALRVQTTARSSG